MKLAGGVLLLLSSAAEAQWPGDQDIPAVQYPNVPRHAARIEGFVPKEWKLEARATGDLNGDQLPDAALVLHMDDPRNRIATAWDPKTRYDTNPRMLVVAFSKHGGGFELATVDYKLIPRLENPNQDDPFDEMKIVGGTLRVKVHLFMSAGGWQMGGSAYTFRWQDGGFKLIGFDRDSVMRNSGETEEVSINYLTGHKEMKKGNIESEKEQTSSVRMRRKPLLTLDQIGDGLSFNPDEH